MMKQTAKKSKPGSRRASKAASLEVESPSQQIDAIIQASGDWRGKKLSQLRAFIKKADPAVVEEVKWKKPSRPEGVAVWSHDGMLCIGEMLKNAVRLTFPQGAQLKDPKQLFNARLTSKSVRAVDFNEGDAVDQAALTALVLQAVGQNTRKEEPILQLTSPAFQDGQEMAQKYGKKIENVSLPLAWKGAPKGTKSFVLALVDRDNHNYVHWIVTGIGAKVTELKEGAANHGQLPTGARELKPYAGPFPPSGTHTYEIILYALKTEELDLPAKVTFDLFTQAAKTSSLATATLVGTFTKQRK